MQIKQLKIPKINLGSWRIWAVAAVVAGIVHILTALAMSEFSGQPAHDRLAQSLPMHKFEVLPPVAPGSQPLPFLSPDFRYAFCRFNTAQGSVTVAASLPDSGWTLSVFTRNGENVFTQSGQAGRKTDMTLLLTPPGERFLGISQEAVAAQPAGALLAVSASEGLVIIRAPIRGYSHRRDSVADLRRATCSYRRQ